MPKGQYRRKIKPETEPIAIGCQTGTSKADRDSYAAYADRCRNVYGCEPAPIGIYLRVNPQYAFYAIFD